jgi:NAD(P)H dehydrogenase (quinone)
MIVVTGATGRLGGLIVKYLAKRVPPSEIRVSVRDPNKAGDLIAMGVRVRYGDFTDPQSMAWAFDGASQVLIVSSNAQAYGGDPLTQHHNAIAAAKAANVKRIVYTSHMAASFNSKFLPMRTHAATEEMLAESELEWTSLRNGFYASSALRDLQMALPLGFVELPADGPVAWTTHENLAECAAEILANEGCFTGPTPPLTATAALNFSELVTLASKSTGQDLQRVTIPDEVMGAKLMARGASVIMQKLTLGFFAASRAKEFAQVDPSLSRLIRRPAESMGTVIENWAKSIA